VTSKLELAQKQSNHGPTKYVLYIMNCEEGQNSPVLC